MLVGSSQLLVNTYAIAVIRRKGDRWQGSLAERCGGYTFASKWDRNRQKNKVLDVVISHPRAHAEPRVADTPGIAAYIAALKKEYLYYNNFVIPAGHMVPLSAETGGDSGGRLDATFSNFLKEVVTSGMDFGESPVPVWTKEMRALFTSRLRSAHVTISYAIARCVANALIYGSKTNARYPVR